MHFTLDLLNPISVENTLQMYSGNLNICKKVLVVSSKCKYDWTQNDVNGYITVRL